jgi:hypothetical protein
MRVGGGRILLDGYEIGLYFLSEWFVLGLLPLETIRQISRSLHVTEPAKNWNIISVTYSLCVYHVMKDE